MDWLTWAALPVLILALWTYTATISSSLPTLRGKRICLLIAHPDDEAMFFGPTVMALARPELGNHIKILCLSSGNADGLGEIRKKELVKSGMLLGLRSEDDILVLDDDRFPDSMTATWPAPSIASVLTQAFHSHGAHPTIDALVTFDRAGVSSHPNHVSLHAGAHAFLARTASASAAQPTALYTLTTTNVLRKYLSVLDLPLTMAAATFAGKEARGGWPNALVYVNGVGGWARGRRAMTDAHRSQMLWFRWGWIALSRYMVVNTLRREVLPRGK